MERSLDLQNGTGRQNRILLLVEGVLQIHMVEREKENRFLPHSAGDFAHHGSSAFRI